MNYSDKNISICQFCNADLRGYGKTYYVNDYNQTFCLKCKHPINQKPTNWQRFLNWLSEPNDFAKFAGYK